MLWIPILYMLTDQAVMFVIILPITFIILLIDALRVYSRNFAKSINQLLTVVGLNKIVRPSEKKSLSGITYTMLAAAILIIPMDKHVFIIAFSVLAISDVISGYFGIRFGTHQLFDKSFEGFVAFFISAAIISVALGLFYKINIYLLLVSALASAIAELTSNKIRINDNLLIPLSFYIIWEGLHLWLV